MGKGCATSAHATSLTQGPPKIERVPKPTRAEKAQTIPSPIIYNLRGKVLPIGQRPIALLDSSKSINIKPISTAATVYLMSTALQNCKINCLYSVLPWKLEVIMLFTLINWYKSYVLFHVRI